MDIYLAAEINKSMIESVADGTGVRLVIFTCGCPHHCIECQNPKSWDTNEGIKVSVNAVASHIIKILNEGRFDGITLSGGDPLYQPDAIFELLKDLKSHKSNLNIWCYTGYIYNDIKNLKALKLIDVLVDGPFEKNNVFPKKKFRGSTNQRILYLHNGNILREE